MKSSMKHLVLFLLIFCMSWVSVLAQKDMEARKLQLALYAINHLYVDSTSLWLEILMESEYNSTC